MTSSTSQDQKIQVRQFTAESCHELGYAWRIEAPASFSTKQIEMLHGLLVQATDIPDQSALTDLLLDQSVLANLGPENREKIHEIRVTVDQVHRSSWAQSFEPHARGPEPSSSSVQRPAESNRS